MHAEAYSGAEVMHGPLAAGRHGLSGAGARGRATRREPSMAEAADAPGRQGRRPGLRHLGARARAGTAAAACRDAAIR